MLYKPNRFVYFLALICFTIGVKHQVSIAAPIQQRLVLIGGGSQRPVPAIKQFADWSTQQAAPCQNSGRILIIAWASQIPQEVAAGICADFKPHFTGAYDYSLTPPASNLKRQEFLQQLAQATGIFFTGGDQGRILDLLNGSGGAEIKAALKAAFAAGLVFGGTSAGTAIMSQTSILGVNDDGTVQLGEGLGLLPDNVIVDQHFSQRNRRERLLRAQSYLGLPYAFGIDENTALILSGEESVMSGRVVGANSVYIFHHLNDQNKTDEKKLNDGDSLFLSALDCVKILK